MHRDDLAQELGTAGARELLCAAPLARLAYQGPDGFPRAIPIAFHWTGTHVVVCTAPSSPKVRAITSHPRVALTIDTDEQPARALQIRGVATMELVEGIPEEYIAASTKSLDPAGIADFTAHVRSVYSEMARISIEPQWARFYDFGAGRLPAFLPRLPAPPEH
jgi:hypothetical protein